MAEVTRASVLQSYLGHHLVSEPWLDPVGWFHDWVSMNNGFFEIKKHIIGKFNMHIHICQIFLKIVIHLLNNAVDVYTKFQNILKLHSKLNWQGNIIWFVNPCLLDSDTGGYFHWQLWAKCKIQGINIKKFCVFYVKIMIFCLIHNFVHVTAALLPCHVQNCGSNELSIVKCLHDTIGYETWADVPLVKRPSKNRWLNPGKVSMGPLVGDRGPCKVLRSMEITMSIT